ncbi:MAG: peroxiredoxin [Proteobacteria bacterium]|nr:peroxiredoxin [Pseudomonadota bacterium]
MSLTVGEKAPDFSLIADNGKPFKLSSKIKNKVLLVFYPGDGTPVCTKQLCEYRDGLSEFSDLGVEIIGVSANDVKSHVAFKKDNELPFTLLTDDKGEVASKYDSLGWFGIKRSLFLIDKNMELMYQHIESVSIFSRSLDELTEAIKKKV